MERLNSTELSQRNPVPLQDGREYARVLLLDDDDASLRIMQGVLNAAGYECMATQNAQDALDIIARQNDIGVVVSDIRMPDIDGLMFLDRLRELRKPRLPRVLFLTGHPSLDNAIAALRRGAVDFLMKPLRPKELLEAVDRAYALATQAASTTPADNLTVENLASQAEQLANRLRMLTPATPRATPATLSLANDNAATESSPRGTEQLLDAMEQLRRLRRDYHKILGDLDDVAWELLIEALRSNRESKQISVSGLSISIEGISSTTALRRINELVARGHLQRIPDPTDARRDFIVLDVKTRDALENYLTRVAVHIDQARRGANR